MFTRFLCIAVKLIKKSLKPTDFKDFKQSVGESNPCFRRERATS